MYLMFLGLAVLVLGAGYAVTHADTKSQVDESARVTRVKLCEQQEASALVLRKVVNTATQPRSSTPITLPADPGIPTAVHDYIERAANALIMSGDNSTLRADLLAQVPKIRCTSEGMPMPIKEKP